jgi:hypothetical protein
LRDARDVSGEIKLHQGSSTGAQGLYALHATEECAKKSSARKKESPAMMTGLFVEDI